MIISINWHFKSLKHNWGGSTWRQYAKVPHYSLIINKNFEIKQPFRMDLSSIELLHILWTFHDEWITRGRPKCIGKKTVILKLHYVRFGDLESSVVEMCNCMQRTEEHFLRRLCIRTLPWVDDSDDCKCAERVIKESSVKTWWRPCLLRM